MFLGNTLASKTPLHHDYHDNLYYLVKGRKEFRLYSPKVGLDEFHKKEDQVLHENGLFAYECDLRDDGVPVDMDDEDFEYDDEHQTEQ